MPTHLQLPLLDFELAMARVGGDTELLKELGELFMEEYPRILTELRAAYSKHDANGVERSAHGLKGSVANFGAQSAVDAAFRIEQMGRQGNLQEVGQELQVLELALLALRTDLSAL
ncbi:MAG: Hpt domain-containing protein [Acidobacteriota bacterium]